MVEKVLKGSPKYYLWLMFLLAVIGYAFIVYVFQLMYGLEITGLSRNISWGFYIAQFTYLLFLTERQMPMFASLYDLV